MNPKQAKSVKLHRLFEAAEVFREASELLRANLVPTQMRMAAPWAVNGAFALELYLKCLLTIECGAYPDSHDLSELFRNLPRQTRHTLRKIHDKAADQDATFARARAAGYQTDLASLLEAGRDVFTQLRYAFENDPKGMWGLNIFSFFVRKRILGHMDAHKKPSP